MEEDINNTVAADGSNLVTDEGAVVQIIMRGEDGDTLIPSHQLIQINTDEGQMQYLEVSYFSLSLINPEPISMQKFTGFLESTNVRK